MTEGGSQAVDNARAEGREAGRIDQVLKQHDKHFLDLNHSVEKTGDKFEQVAVALSDLSSEIRGLREDARIRDERVKVAADTLATETERRREELANAGSVSDRKFTRREKIAGSVVAVASAVAGYFLQK